MTHAITHHKLPSPSPPAKAPDTSPHVRQYANNLTRLYLLEKQRADDLLSSALMQQRFLTPSDEILKMLQPYGYEIATFSQSPHTVSGDFLCSRAVDYNRAILLLGDTLENGLRGALFSMRISNLIQTAPLTSPSEFLEYVHKDINGLLSSGKFVAASYLILSQNTITLANAGLPMPILLHKGRTSEINASGIPLGLPLGAGQYRNISLLLTPGDRIILYTDGVTSAKNSAGETISRLQFRSLLEKYPMIDVHDLLEETISELRTHMNEQPIQNDISIVIIEYQG